LKARFRGISIENRFLDHDEYDFENKSFVDSSSFMDWNQPSKFNEDDKNDSEGGNLDAKLFICDVHEKRTKLDVIFNEANCNGYA
jgi:hypothetical protein